MPPLLALVAVSLLALVATLLALPVLALLALIRAIVRLWRRPRLVTVPNLTALELEAATPLVIAVHGTWAPLVEGDAHWALPGSALHGAVTAAVAARVGVPPVWHAFGWSGDNSAHGRSAAMTALAALVRQATTRHPQRFVLLLGHSHGGNIAAVVAQQLEDRTGIHVVTLATPFLTLAERHETAALGDLLTLVPGVSLAFAAAAVASAFLEWTWLPTTGVLFAGIGLAAVMAVRARRARAATLDLLRTSTLDPRRLDDLHPRTFIVSRIGDEADAGLNLTAFAASWVVRAMGQASMVEATDSLTERVRRASASGGAVPTPREMVGLAWRTHQGWSRALTELVALLLGLGLLVLLQLVAGTSSALAAVGLHVGSSETPPGTWHHLQSTWAGTPGASLLSHSQIYDDEAVIAAVAVWVSQCVAVVAQTNRTSSTERPA